MTETLSELVKKYRGEPIVVEHRILVFDIETAARTAYVWRTGEQWVRQEQLITDSYIISIAWSWLDEEEIHVAHLTPAEAKKGNDKRIITEFLKVLDRADYIAGHNITRFDEKEISTRLFKHGMKPLSPSKHLDTLRMARKHFNFNSNKLDDICQWLGIGQKHETGLQLWKDVMKGCPDAMARMAEYNKQDVNINKELLKKLLPFTTLSIKLKAKVVVDAGLVEAVRREHECPCCGTVGQNHINSRYTTRAGTLRIYVMCIMCGNSSQLNKGFK